VYSQNCTVWAVTCTRKAGWQVEHVWNVMAHAQKPYLVFQRNGQVHLNWWGGGSVQLTTDSWGVGISGSNGSNAGYSMFWGRVQDCWLPTTLTCFTFTSPTGRHRVSSGFNWVLPSTEWHCQRTHYNQSLCKLPNFASCLFKSSPIGSHTTRPGDFAITVSRPDSLLSYCHLISTVNFAHLQNNIKSLISEF
jgi:hypothetical protein